MTRHFLLAVLVAALALSAALLAGPASPAALLGSGIAAGTALASLAAFRAFARSPSKPLQRALAVFVAMFLVRLVLVALGLLHVHRAGGSVVAFVVAFFVPYFAFVAIEGGLVHALGRRAGSPA
ncbi:MAG TPA: hypothetical protein VH880_02835 [Anaeromyxobacteraceae bacterium]